MLSLIEWELVTGRSYRSQNSVCRNLVLFKALGKHTGIKSWLKDSQEIVLTTRTYKIMSSECLQRGKLPQDCARPNIITFFKVSYSHGNLHEEVNDLAFLMLVVSRGLASLMVL